MINTKNSGKLKKTILINLVPISSGGGLQNALSFIEQMHEITELKNQSIVICKLNSSIHYKCIEEKIDHICIGSNLVSRLYFEMFYALKVVKKFKIKCVFTLFGAPPLITLKSINVSGFAYSNLLHREVEFWDFLPWRKRILKFIKDNIRYYGYWNADAVIFETDLLLKKTSSTYFSRKRKYVINMEPSQLVSKHAYSKLRFNLDRQITFLILSSAHPNKRIELFIRVFSEFKKKLPTQSSKRPKLIITIDTNNSYSKLIQKEIHRLDLDDDVELIGTVPASIIHQIIEASHFIVNVAKLESFSNNWVEAWSSGRILVSADTEWARHSCKNAAIYIDPFEYNLSALKIISVVENQSKAELLISNGKLRLNELSRTPKIRAYWDVITSELNII